jgi:metallo-beta-lactamase class B
MQTSSHTLSPPRIAGLLAVFTLFATALPAAELVADPPHDCEPCAEWGRAREPFRVFGNTWFVGGGLSSILITSKQGHILIDGGLTQSAPIIAANIRKLGFRLEDVRLILNSHTHYDHAGGIAALQRASGAQVAASPAAKRALENGGPVEDDPQFSFGPEHNNFPAITGVRAIHDGETLRVGDLRITAHFTPGHTPGGTSWSWKSCDQGDCKSMVYADSLNSVSAPGFRFTGDTAHPSRVAAFEHSIDVVAGMDCGILLAPHPESFELDAKLAARAGKPSPDPFIDPAACKAYADGARERLKKRVAEETAGK